MTVTYDQMAATQLTYCRLPATINNVRSMVTWAVSEGSKAKWNIWDTEQPADGATDYNTAGVKNYPNEAVGLAAFSTTLYNGYYPGIIQALQASAPPAETCNMIYNSPWGSKPTPELLASVLTDWSNYSNWIVSGSEGIPTPTPIPVPELPVEDDDMPLYTTDSKGTGYVVASNLTSKLGISDGADAAALLATGLYKAVKLSDEQIGNIPNV